MTLLQADAAAATGEAGAVLEIKASAAPTIVLIA